MLVFTKTKTESGTNSKFVKKICILAVLTAIFIFSGCYEIKTINQASTVEAGSQITSSFSVELDLNSSGGERHGIVGLMVPNDWLVDSVSFNGFYSGNCTYLPQGTPDADTGKVHVDYWTDSLETRYPSGDDMQWIVFQTDSSYVAETVVDSVTVTVEMTVGETEGEFGLGYFVSDGSGDFTSEDAYSDSLNNMITVTPVTGVEDEDLSIPNEFELTQNYPNPFNPTTTINFSLPSASNVTVTLYNVLGAKIMTVVNNQYSAGNHQVSIDASDLASGTYIYSLTASGKDGSKFTASKKMVLLK